MKKIFSQNSPLQFFFPLLILLGAITAGVWAERKISFLNEEISNQQRMLEQSFRQKEEVKKISQSSSDFNAEMQSLNTVFIQKGKELEFITELENIAEKSHVSLDINLGEISSNETLPLGIHITGKYQDLFLFLSQLETLPTYYQIQEISILRQSALTSGTHYRAENITQTESLQILSATLLGTVYFLP